MPKGIYPGNQNWSSERRKKISESMVGKQPWNKGKPWNDRTKNKISQAKMKPDAKKAAGWARAAKLYQNIQCEICDKSAEIHHIDENPLNNVRSNVRFLCRSHHKVIHINHKKYFGKADIIFALEVAEYLVDPTQFLKNIKNCLGPTAKAIVSFPLIYPTHNELELDSMRFTESGINRLAEKAGLRVANIWYRTDRSGLLQSFYSSDGMHPAKQYEHHNVTGFIVEFTK